MERLKLFRHDTKTHRCNLPGEPWDILPKYIEGGIFVNFRRWAKRLTMIDKRHPLTAIYAPSLRRLKREEKSHLVQHFYMIHPYSMFSFYFNMIVAHMLILFFVSGPVIYSLTHRKMELNYIMLPTNSVYIAIIIKTFMTGYFDPTSNMVTLNSKNVAKQYLRTYLVFDVLRFVPQILRFFQIDDLIQKSTYNLVTPLLIMASYVRYFWCVKVLEHIRLHYGISTFTYKILLLMLNVIVGLVLSVFIIFSLFPDMPRNNVQVFLNHFEDTLKMLMLVSHGRRSRFVRIEEVILSSFFIIVGFIFHLAILVQTMEIFSKYISADSQQVAVYDSVNAYMRYKALPMSLRDRILLYLEFKFQGHFFKESTILKATSYHLRKEVLLAASRRCIQKINILSNVPPKLLKKVSTSLVSEIYLPGDIIIKAGLVGHCMFVLVAGTVLVTTTEDKPVCYLRDGAHFGEVALLINLYRVANVVAVSPCEVFKLDKSRFWAILVKYPHLFEEMRKAALEQLVTLAEADNIVDRPDGLVNPKSSSQ